MDCGSSVGVVDECKFSKGLPMSKLNNFRKPVKTLHLLKLLQFLIFLLAKLEYFIVSFCDSLIQRIVHTLRFGSCRLLSAWGLLFVSGNINRCQARELIKHFVFYGLFLHHPHFDIHSCFISLTSHCSLVLNLKFIKEILKDIEVHSLHSPVLYLRVGHLYTYLALYNDVKLFTLISPFKHVLVAIEMFKLESCAEFTDVFVLDISIFEELNLLYHLDHFVDLIKCSHIWLFSEDIL